jgi:hypothetical protein
MQPIRYTLEGLPRPKYILGHCLDKSLDSVWLLGSDYSVSSIGTVRSVRSPVAESGALYSRQRLAIPCITDCTASDNVASTR